MSDLESFNKENYQFYFPVLGYFDGDRIIFMTDAGTDVRNDGKYIFDLSREDWATVNNCSNEIWVELQNLDHQVLSELMNRLSLIGKDKGGE